MIKNKTILIEARNKCQEAKIGDNIICPSCETTHLKKSYQSVFCKSKGKTKCKDNFWNNVDENKRKNVSRFSPASIRWSARMELQRGDSNLTNHFNVGHEDGYNPHDDEHPFSSEALGQWND